MDVLPYKQFNEIIKASDCRMYKRLATRMSKILFGLNQMQTNAFRQTSCKKNNFSRIVSNENAL